MVSGRNRRDLMRREASERPKKLREKKKTNIKAGEGGKSEAIIPCLLSFPRVRAATAASKCLMSMPVVCT